jgi:hypothetical protein
MSVFIAMAACAADAQMVIAPTFLANVDGNSAQAGSATGSRIQTLYDASIFSGYESLLIKEIAYRPDKSMIGQAPASVTIPSISVILSTTTKQVGGLSLTYSDNLGSDASLAYSGPLTVSSHYTGPPGGPANFDIFIPLQTPFTYHPKNGNLIVDITNPGFIALVVDFNLSLNGSQISYIAGDASSSTGSSLACCGGGLGVGHPTEFLGDFTPPPTPQTPPSVTCSATPSTLWPPNGKAITITVTGTVTPGTQPIAPEGAAYVVIDEYAQVQPSGRIALGVGGSYSFGVSLIAARNGNDRDGRTYTIVVGSRDTIGNLGSCSTVVTVPHDQGH